MYSRPKACPNPDCLYHVGEHRGFFIKFGTYRPKHNHQPVPTYRCKHCGKRFSATINKPKRQQHRPKLNREVLNLLASGVTGRRAALLLSCHRRTLDRKVAHLVAESQKHHSAMLAELKTGHVMMDELITFIHARPKHVSVAVVVRVKTGQILGFTVSRLAAHEGYSQRYDWWLDETGKKIPVMLRKLAPHLKQGATITTDAHPSYNKWIREAMPGVVHQSVKAINSKLAQKNSERDPLFAINFLFAKMRNDMARLARKTWTTSKSIKGLEQHLWLYLAWVNGYPLS